MAPTTQQRIANILTLVGLLPFALWIVLILWIRIAKPYGGAGLSDAMYLLLIGGLLYALAIALAGPAMLWAHHLRSRSAQRQSWLGRAPAILGMFVLTLPWLALFIGFVGAPWL